MIEEIKKLKLTIDVLNRKIGALEKTAVGPGAVRKEKVGVRALRL